MRSHAEGQARSLSRYTFQPEPLQPLAGVRARGAEIPSIQWGEDLSVDCQAVRSQTRAVQCVQEALRIAVATLDSLKLVLELVIAPAARGGSWQLAVRRRSGA